MYNLYIYDFNPLQILIPREIEKLIKCMLAGN